MSEVDGVTPLSARYCLQFNMVRPAVPQKFLSGDKRPWRPWGTSGKDSQRG